MREIKFRGLRIDGKGWAYGYYRKNTFYSKLSEDKKEVYTWHFIGTFDNLTLFDGIFEQVEVIPESVGQFTGLKDKNGKEIYEGDWLHICSGYASYVDFQDGMFVSVYTHPEDGEIIPLFDAIGKSTEIIGNIHEKV